MGVGTIIFRVRETFTKEDVTAFYEGLIRKRAGSPEEKRLDPRQMRAVYAVFLAAGIGFSGLKLSGLDQLVPFLAPWQMWIFCGLLILVGGYGLYQWERRSPRWVEQVWKQVRSFSSGEYLFQEEGFYIRPRCGDQLQSYGALEQIWEDEGHFYLQMKESDQVFQLCKRCFIQGTPEDFAAFLGQKAGKTVQPVTPGK